MPKIRITALILSILSLVLLLVGTFSREWRYRFSRLSEGSAQLEYWEGWGLSDITICIKCVNGCEGIEGERRACNKILYAEHLASLESRLERARKMYFDDAPDVVRLQDEIRNFRAIDRWGPIVRKVSFAGFGVAGLFIFWALLHRRRLPALVPLVLGVAVGLALVSLDLVFITFSRTAIAPKLTHAAVLHLLGAALLLPAAWCLFRKPVDPFAAIMAEVVPDAPADATEPTP
ncbi:hypothetical protein KKD52_01435 [Myxococcota bacterium]|nr:hypothetical protein [Myxococcota bacterium]MBU1411777.1 hypothetical protein [Myxococcota bacterium]MBU1508994.1 hypothetical protein [Myxococcota bacterium]PKN25504.1 MAG: hypothetical protein CVU65_08650 [Deltaproteobacteria bacterium HGW-Deltaproteobacteria-22]